MDRSDATSPSSEIGIDAQAFLRRIDAKAGEGPFGEHSADFEPIDFLQVAFAGHNRPGDLGDAQAAAAGLSTAFRILSEAGVARARLLTGLAEGADVIAAEAWRKVGLGPMHAVFPFLHHQPPPDAAHLMNHAVWLHGQATRKAGRNPYLAQSRWLIGAADLLVVLWSGQRPRGAGGTADAIRLALEQGVPVLWVKPGREGRLSLIRPERLDEDFGFLEFLEQVKDGDPPFVEIADPASVRAALLRLGFPSTPQPAADRQASRRRPFDKAYALFRRALGGKTPALPSPAPPPDLMDQPGFERLSRVQAQADEEASRLGALHRSHQVILIGLAILAAGAGSVSALWPGLKTAMVGLELLLAIGALLIWRDSERGLRHQRWGQARRLAEDLRLERAAWTVGVSTAPHGLHMTSIEAARRERRLAGLPTGAFDDARLLSWGQWLKQDLLEAQAAYHRCHGETNARISHRVHQLENISFTVLLAVMATYLLISLVVDALGQEPPHWLGGVVSMAGAVVPALGAAGLALEATLSLGEEAQRSTVLASRLEDLLSQLAAHPSLEAIQRIARAAIRLQRAQEDHWTEGAVRRRLVRGG